MPRSTLFRFVVLVALSIPVSEAIADEPEPAKRMPRVLLIGDSISRGYAPLVKKRLAGEVEVVQRSTGTTGHGLKSIDKWLAEHKWDVIHFNWGLHDLCYRHPDSKVYGHRDKVKGTIGTTLEQYEKNLDQLVSKLKAGGVKLVWASTTVIPEGEAGRFVGDDAKYNAVGAKVMKKHGVVTNDLYALSKGFGADHFTKPGDVHYKPVGSRRLADMVATAIRVALRRGEKPAYKKEILRIEGRPGFVIVPTNVKPGKPIPWLWYAPSFGAGPDTSGPYYQQCLANGIAIAGVDVGESYGSPKGRAIFSAFYNELVTKHGFAKQACLYARSRGGLMLYSWAAENPEKVHCVIGVYPVTDLRSYPGLARACGAYGMTADQLRAKLSEHNPVDRLAPLAKAKVPIYHFHGDKDKVVPHGPNSVAFERNYEKHGGTMTLEIITEQGHNLWPGWFHNLELVDFVLKHALEE